jgi:tetratricopeptide (TPR) repeat protein
MPTSTSALMMPASRYPVWLLATVLVLVTLALYWPATRYDFIGLDDPQFVTDNPHVQDGLSWADVKWAFGNTDRAVSWVPLLWLSHQLAWQLFGANPWGHHLINVLLHAANTALVFLVFRRMTAATWRSLILAALFGLHPLRVESVVWVTERKDVLSTLFFLLTLLTYVQYAQEPGARSKQQGISAPLILAPYCWSLFFFACGLMSKPMLVTVPFVLLLLDYWPLGRVTGDERWVTRIRHLVFEKIPFFGLATVASVVTFVAQKTGGAVAQLENLPLGARMGNALISYCRYLEKSFWPMDLAVFYPHPGNWPPAEVLLAGGLLLGVTGLFIVLGRRYPFMLTGWLWFCGMLVPVIGLVQVGEQSMADRYTYLPSIGVLILVVWSAHELTSRWRHQRIILLAAGLTVVVLCIKLTQRQLGYWRDEEMLFRHALTVTQDNYLAYKALGDALFNKGQIDEAIDQYNEAIQLKPYFVNAYYTLGIALLKEGRTDAAIRQFQEAIRFKPAFADAHNALGSAWLGKGRIDEAIRQFQEAIRLKPDDADARYNLGNAFRRTGQIDEAIRQFQKVIRLTPNDASAHNNLGTVLGMQNQIEKAISQFQEAIRLKPDYAYAHYNLGNALLLANQTNSAINQFQEAIRLEPNDTFALNALGYLWVEHGENLEQARAMLEKAVQLAPRNAPFLGNLGWALLKLNRPGEALDCLLKSVENSDKPDAALYDHLGDAYAALNQPDKAAEAWRKSLSVEPNPRVQKKLGDLSAH